MGGEACAEEGRVASACMNAMVRSANTASACERTIHCVYSGGSSHGAPERQNCSWAVLIHVDVAQTEETQIQSRIRQPWGK